MSQENVEIVRRVYDAAARRDAATVLALYDPDVELDASRLGIAGIAGEDTAVYLGHDGLRRFFRGWHEAWTNIAYDFEELIDAGDEHVIAVVTRRARGRASGVAVERPFALVWTLRGGKVIRVAWFLARAEALEAVGLSEQLSPEENLEVVRRAYKMFDDAGFSGAAGLDLGVFDEGIEVDTSRSPSDADLFRGHDGLREFLSLQRGLWKRRRLEPQEFIPVGEDRVVVATRIASVGRNGVKIVSHAASVWTLHAGKIKHVKLFEHKGEALEAVGLSE
jgi:ketosteroid isomerase-like protein